MAEWPSCTTSPRWSRPPRSGAGEVSPLDLVEHYLARIAPHGETLGAFVTVTPDVARAQAARRAATRGPLAGVPMAIKDLDDDRRGTDHVRLGRVRRLRAHRRRRRGGAHARGRADQPRQDHDERVRAVALLRDRGRAAGPQPVGASTAPPAARAAVRRPRWPPGWCRSPTAATAADRCASRRRSAASSASSRAAGWSAAGRSDSAGSACPTNGPIARTVADAAALLDILAEPAAGEPYLPPPRPTAGCWSRPASGGVAARGPAAAGRPVRHPAAGRRHPRPRRGRGLGRGARRAARRARLRGVRRRAATGPATG